MHIFILGIVFVMISVSMLWMYVYLPQKQSIKVVGTIIDYDVIEQEEGLMYVAKVIYEDPLSHETKETQLSRGLPLKKDAPQKTTLVYQMKSHDIDLLEDITPYAMTSFVLMVVGVIMILLFTGGYL